MGILTISTAVLAVLSCSFALDFNGIAEHYNCADQFTPDPKIDQRWMLDVSIWYMPFWNNVDYYQNAADFFGKEEFAKLSPADLEKTCLYYQVNGTTAEIYGFGGRILNYETFPDPIRTGVFHWGVRNAKKELEYHATTYHTKTNNKNYFFAVTIWANGMKGFNVGAKMPKLDGVSLAEIKEHAKGLGFDPKHFVETDYTKCPPPPSFLTATNKHNRRSASEF